ncbi:hypothetical protein [Crossiella sp. CA198]|uniref:hypothetical protein n=1 Tax=Crossiella sp. CA198 TaxID=3455607 RepID=UPI003F8D38EE
MTLLQCRERGWHSTYHRRSAARSAARGHRSGPLPIEQQHRANPGRGMKQLVRRIRPASVRRSGTTTSTALLVGSANGSVDVRTALGRRVQVAVMNLPDGGAP